MRLSFLTLLAVLMLPGVALPQAPTLSPSPSPGLYAIDSQDPQGLQELFRYTGDFLPLVSAHRGGPQQRFPENCLATFENTLQKTALWRISGSGIQVEVLPQPVALPRHRRMSFSVPLAAPPGS